MQELWNRIIAKNLSTIDSSLVTDPLLKFLGLGSAFKLPCNVVLLGNATSWNSGLCTHNATHLYTTQSPDYYRRIVYNTYYRRIVYNKTSLL